VYQKKKICIAIKKNVYDYMKKLKNILNKQTNTFRTEGKMLEDF